MSETKEVTQAQSIRLKLLSLVGYDTAAAADAIAFVADDPFSAELFEKQFERPELMHLEVISRARKAIQESKEALLILNGPEA
ncbi:DUF2560 family protein [Serratia plymuthica]|uniref:DUF2560 family protein n=1 Tax=Serratia TaxID=613 RepID=UPI0018F6822E|nr:DUF2560 family protein [Serratia sp. PAMC26656]MBJ7894175.1 DUF2560 family protein [Serratia sp. PAMC26656]